MEARSQQIVTNLTQDVRGKFQDQNSYLQTLSQLMQQYESIGFDLIQLKMKYVEIVKQYSMNNDFHPTPNTFPGLIQAVPTFSPDKMQADSKQLQEMGEVINDLESQKQLVYNQIRQILEAIVVTTTSASTTIDQISIFLSQMINDVSLDGTYGSPTLKSLII
jgi:RNase adaptor protein for sRNA GlmZ degradation